MWKCAAFRHESTNLRHLTMGVNRLVDFCNIMNSTKPNPCLQQIKRRRSTDICTPRKRQPVRAFQVNYASPIARHTVQNTQILKKHKSKTIERNAGKRSSFQKWCIVLRTEGNFSCYLTWSANYTAINVPPWPPNSVRGLPTDKRRRNIKLRTCNVNWTRII